MKNQATSIDSLLERLDYLEGNDGPEDDDGNGDYNNNDNPYNDGNWDGLLNNFPPDDNDDPIIAYKDFKHEYYFHHNWDEKCLADPNYRHCDGLTEAEYREGKKNGCIPECEFYNMNPTVEEALTALRSHIPDWPNNRRRR